MTLLLICVKLFRHHKPTALADGAGETEINAKNDTNINGFRSW